MNITRNRIKELVRETLVEDNEYQAFFKKALEKAGKSIPNMSDEEKKAFFNKIDASWNGRGEKKESCGDINESPKPIEIKVAKFLNKLLMIYGNNYNLAVRKSSGDIRKFLINQIQNEFGYQDFLSNPALDKYIFSESIHEDKDYQAFFKNALEKSGKSIPEMSDEEKKEFFNKIDAAWNGKGEKKESCESVNESISERELEKFIEQIMKKNGYKSTSYSTYDIENAFSKEWKGNDGTNYMIVPVVRPYVRGGGDFWISILIARIEDKSLLAKLFSKIKTKHNVLDFNDNSKYGYHNPGRIKIDWNNDERDIKKQVIQRLPSALKKAVNNITTRINKVSNPSALEHVNEKYTNESVNEAFGNDYMMNKLHKVIGDTKFMKSTNVKQFISKVDKETKDYFKRNGEHDILTKIFNDYQKDSNWKYDNREYNLEEATVKGRNNKTGESFGIALGADKHDDDGFHILIRNSYSERISEIEWTFDKDNNLVSTTDYGYKVGGGYPSHGGGSGKSYGGNKRETITALAKEYSPAFAKKVLQYVQSHNKSQNEMLYNSMNESKPVKGRKSFYQMNNIGKAKYTISDYDGKSTHKDGSPFYGIDTFKNKKDLEAARAKLFKQGYIEESVNEVKSIDWKRFYRMAKDTTGKTLTQFEKEYGRKLDLPHIKDALDNTKDFNSFMKHINKFESVNESMSFPNMKKWWTEKPDDILTFVYWMQKQLPPNDREKAYRKIASQLNKQFKAPAADYKRLMGESINESRSLSNIASEISRDWKKVNYEAKPYLDAMFSLDSIKDNYHQDSGKSIVAYFLSNARQWKGDTAKRVKLELKKMLKKDLHRSRFQSGNESFDHNKVMDILDIAAQYSSTQHHAANQEWKDAQTLYSYLKSDHIPQKYRKDFYNDVKRKYKIKESVNEASQTMRSMDDMVSKISYSKDGYVKRMTNNAGKLVKDIELDGKKYRYNSVYKTYNSVKGNELLHKSMTESINESMSFPNMKKWWNEKPEDILTFVYWMKRQTPPKDRDKAYKDIAIQLNKQFKAPADIYKGIVDESVNEASKEAMGIAGFTGARGIAVDDFIKKHNIDARKLFNYVKKGNLKDRMSFITALVGKPNNKFFKMIVGRFAESINELNLNKHIWEGWTVQDFIDDLEPQLDMIMNNNSWQTPFKNKSDLKKWCMENQPYYKKYIPDVVAYFVKKYKGKIK